jgi:hypothetical protein
MRWLSSAWQVGEKLGVRCVLPRVNGTGTWLNGSLGFQADAWALEDSSDFRPKIAALCRRFAPPHLSTEIVYFAVTAASIA